MLTASSVRMVATSPAGAARRGAVMSVCRKSRRGGNGKGASTAPFPRCRVPALLLGGASLMDGRRLQRRVAEVGVEIEDLRPVRHHGLREVALRIEHLLE